MLRQDTKWLNQGHDSDGSGWASELSWRALAQWAPTETQWCRGQLWQLGNAVVALLWLRQRPEGTPTALVVTLVTANGGSGSRLGAQGHGGGNQGFSGTGEYEMII